MSIHHVFTSSYRIKTSSSFSPISFNISDSASAFFEINQKNHVNAAEVCHVLPKIKLITISTTKSSSE
uniref:Putative ovule protein n=1 Tax=Solanum chacoense TaxID=4108 RepID=A0A0V0HEZ2_SOLCH